MAGEFKISCLVIVTTAGPSQVSLAALEASCGVKGALQNQRSFAELNELC